jgi:ferrous iron transport protein B
MLEKSIEKTITVALAGSPNVGKSTVFNLLTGLSQYVGNWPGKTVEQKTGTFRRGGLTMNIVDLPGTYSLTANSAEEQIARDYLVTEKPDVVVAVLNAASLERNLYLMAELIELAPRMVIALNMMDVAHQQGKKISTVALSDALNIPVVPITASKNRGLTELMEQVVAEYNRPGGPREVKHIEFGTAVEQVIDRVAEVLTPDITGPYPRHWTAMKLLEGDEQIKRMVRERIPADRRPRLEVLLKANEGAAVTIATLRYEWVGRMIAIAQEKPALGRVSLTERIDRAATHPIWGMLILFAVLGSIFGLVYSIGIPLQHFLEKYVIENLQALIFQYLGSTPSWLQHFLADGILGGAGIVLTFIPILLLFFAAWALMEDVGYTVRAAFVTDRFMHLLGLHGKSVLPLCLGLGCNVPAVMGTRIIDSPRARLLTLLLTPLVPCSGRMAVVAIIAAAFFGSRAFFVSMGVMVFSLIIIMAVGFILNRFALKGESEVLIMELPLYHIPKPGLIARVTWQNLLAFLKHAGTIILIVSVIVWALSVIPGGKIDDSVLAWLGKLIEPLGKLMGLNWQMMVALISSFVAKENTIATLGVLLSGSGADFTNQLRIILTPAAALAFLVVQVLFIPCAATVAAMKQETGGWRWPLFSIALQLVISFGMAILVYQVAKLLMP